MDDQTLIAGCLEGRKDAWDLFVDRFSRLIYWAIRKTLDASSFKARAELTHEIFQEIFVRLLEKNELEKLRSIDSLRKFLTVMACHAAMDKIRSLSRLEKKLDGDISLASETLVSEGAAAEAITREQAALITGFLSELPPRQRLCVEWHYLEGKTHREIAEILGLPQDTVSAVIRRTREKLKQFFLKNDN